MPSINFVLMYSIDQSINQLIKNEYTESINQSTEKSTERSVEHSTLGCKENNRNDYTNHPKYYSWTWTRTSPEHSKAAVDYCRWLGRHWPRGCCPRRCPDETPYSAVRSPNRLLQKKDNNFQDSGYLPFTTMLDIEFIPFCWPSQEITRRGSRILKRAQDLPRKLFP